MRVAQVLRVARAVRLLKLLRLAKGSAMLTRYRAQISIQYSTLTTLWCLTKYLLCGHWFACLLILQVGYPDVAQ